MTTRTPQQAPRRRRTLAAFGVLLLASCAATAQQAGVTEASREETRPPFGGPANRQYAEAVWTAMVEAGLAGGEAITTFPYTGTDPHGRVLEYLETTVPIGGRDAWTIVKRNHVAEELAVEDVIEAPRRDLASVTVMVKRESGYDPDNRNWWWAKYDPDGSLQTNPQGAALAGRVAKGADVGCIACHQAAPGGDFVYSHDRTAPPG
jgi:hypothetical protein